jgi:hypothetical protein
MTKDEALRLALEALQSGVKTQFGRLDWIEYDIELVEQAITAIKAALEAKNEPVACADNGVVNWIADKQFMHEAELYTTPPQRTWVGLTEDEILLISADCASTHQHTDIHFARAIEAKLKDRNSS